MKETDVCTLKQNSVICASIFNAGRGYLHTSLNTVTQEEKRRSYTGIISNERFDNINLDLLTKKYRADIMSIQRPRRERK